MSTQYEKIPLDRDLRPASAGASSENVEEVIVLRLDPVSKRLLTNSTIQDPSSGLDVNVKNNVNTTNNELLVNLEGHQCPGNTTVVQLVADEVFTGSSWQDTLDYGVLSINVGSDQNSAADGLVIQWSNDGLTVFDTDKFTILANINKTFTFGPAQRYYRVKYTNGSGGTTTSFHLTSILRKTYVKPSSHRINDAIVGEDDAELVKAISTGLAPDGTYKNVLVTNAGNQKISIEEFETGVSSNSNSQLNTTLFKSDGTELNLDTSGNVVTRGAFQTNDIEEASATVTYIGMESSNGTWWVKKIDTTSGNSFEHASVTTNPTRTTYTLAWTNRATLSYTDYGGAF